MKKEAMTVEKLRSSKSYKYHHTGSRMGYEECLMKLQTEKLEA